MWTNRIIVLLLWILSLVGISFSGGPVTYGFFYFMTLIPIVSLIYLVLVYYFFKVHQSMIGRYLTANHVHPYLFTLQNESLVVFSSVKVNLFSSFSAISGQYDGAVYELMPHSGIKNETTILCKYRGVYEAGIRSVEIQDYFRLFKFTYKPKEILWVVVKPDLIRLQELKSVDLQQLSTRSTNRNLTEPDVLVRKYVSGDDPRMIHWKSSARNKELMVRNRIGEEQQGITVLMSTEQRYSDPENNLPSENKVMETALALSWYFVDKDVPVTLQWLTENFMERTAASHKAFENVYEELSSCAFTPARTDASLFTRALRSESLYNSRLLFLVVQKFTRETADFVDILNQNNIPVIIYLITRDTEDMVLPSKSAVTQVVILSPEDDLKEVL